MTRPPTSVRSIRLPCALWSALQAQADSMGVSLNRYVAMRLETGAVRDLKNAEKALTRATPKPNARPAVHVSVPLAGTFERKPIPKGLKR